MKKAKYILEIYYNEVDKDIVTVCESCKNIIIHDAKNRGYKIKENRYYENRRHK
jgi:hypothetical protein